MHQYIFIITSSLLLWPLLGTVPLANFSFRESVLRDSAIMVVNVSMKHVLVQKDFQELNVETVSIINYVEY